MKHVNPKVLIGVAAVAAVLFAVKPSLVASALPLLLLAICPLSMMFMMRGAGGMHGHGHDHGDAHAAHGMSGSAPEADLPKQVADLQEELRILRATMTQ
ncbi:DUF2933 domain-containing protein [Streptomyces sp. YIM S03343]